MNLNVTNEYGTSDIFSHLEKKQANNSNSLPNGSKSKGVPTASQPISKPVVASSLNKLFAQKSDMKAATVSPNKMVIFKMRTKKE